MFIITSNEIVNDTYEHILGHRFTSLQILAGDMDSVLLAGRSDPQFGSLTGLTRVGAHSEEAGFCRVLRDLPETSKKTNY